MYYHPSIPSSHHDAMEWDVQIMVSSGGEMISSHHEYMMWRYLGNNIHMHVVDVYTSTMYMYYYTPSTPCMYTMYTMYTVYTLRRRGCVVYVLCVLASLDTILTP